MVDVRGFDPNALRTGKIIWDLLRVVADSPVVLVRDDGEAEIIVAEAVFHRIPID